MRSNRALLGLMLVLRWLCLEEKPQNPDLTFSILSGSAVREYVGRVSECMCMC